MYQVGRAQAPEPNDPTFSDLAAAMQAAQDQNYDSAGTVFAVWDMRNPGIPPIVCLVYQEIIFEPRAV